MREMKPMIDSVELSELLEIPVRKANEIIKSINEELKKSGCYVLNTRPAKAPRNKVFEKLGI